MTEKRLTTSCGCFIVRRNPDTQRKEVLLVKPFRDRDAWGVPKGHTDPGETFEDCALREVREETGLVPKIVKGMELPTCIARSRDEVKTVRIYMATITESMPIVGDGENADIRWFDLESLPNLHKYQEGVLQEAVRLADRELSF